MRRADSPARELTLLVERVSAVGLIPPGAPSAARAAGARAARSWFERVTSVIERASSLVGMRGCVGSGVERTVL